MTLVTGMVGRDGIVLAGDKRLIEFAEKEGDCNDTSDGRKIFHLERHKVVYAYTGDWVTLLAGDELKASLDGGQFDFEEMTEALRRIAFRGFEDAVTSFPQRRVPDLKRQLLIVFYGPRFASPQLWDVRISREASAGRIDGMVIAGAMGNTARFFAHYFEFNRPVANLARLAAHIVLMGHKDGFIDGLDVLTVSGDNLHWYTEDEKEPLRKLSEGLDANLRKQFYA